MLANFRVSGAALLTVALLFSGSANAAPNVVPCAADADQAALRVRMVQTELMVAALTCNQRADYNGFVTRFQPELSSHGKHLQSFFGRQYGPGATKALNGFITRIANESSRRGMLKRGEFCRNAAAVHAFSRTMTPGSLPGFAQTLQFSGGHGFNSCPAKVAAARIIPASVKSAKH